MPTIKMLDLHASFAGDAHMARPRTLAWPVLAYRVTLPDTAEGAGDALNPFERLLLTLLEIEGSASEERLAEETCIPEDFVKGVLLRLQDSGYIDDRNAIVRQSASRQNRINFKPAMIFREIVQGKVLPYVLYDTKPEVKLVETGYDVKQMRWSDQRFEPVTPQEVIEAVKDQKRHERVYGDRSSIPKVSSVTVSETGERYFLECPIGMRSTDGEFRIGNPFGKGYSLLLEGVFMDELSSDENLEAWITNWRKNLVFEKGPDKAETVREPFDTDACRQRYPRLIPFLKPNYYGIRTIEKLYSSIEWALFYSNERLGSRNALNLLSVSNPADTPYLVKRAAEAVGVEAPKNGFLRINRLAIDNYRDGVPEMPTALSVALLQAQSDETHPLRLFAKARPNLAIQLYEMKKERDIRSHGKGRGAQSEQSGRNEAFMKELVSALLPDVRFSNEDSTRGTKTDALLDARFEARTSLLDLFGYTAFNTNLLPLTQERLVDAESFWMGFEEGEDALSFVGDLYAALQSELSQRTEAAAIRAKNDHELAVEIEKRAKELKVAPLPISLSTVRPNNIRKALQGLDETTLGGITVAFMMCCDDEEMGRILIQDRSFFADIGEIITARGHLNEARQFTKKEVDGYRKVAYRAVRALMEN